METGLSRTHNQVTSELELKRLHPVAKVTKKDEAKVVLNEPQQDKLDSTSVANEQKEPLNKEELKGVVAKMNATLQDENRSIQFSVDENSGRTIIKVTDAKTGEQIKQIPSEDVLEISRKLTENLDQKDERTGLLVHRKA